MLTYNLDIEQGSLWLRTTPNEFALKQPYYCTEAGIFLARRDFNTERDFKDSYLLFYTIEGCGIIEQDGSTIRLELSGNDSFCADLMTTIADFLQVNLDEAAEASETQLAGGYLVISKATGLPTEMGIYMNKIHTINTVVYELTHTLQQNLSFEFFVQFF